MISRVFVSLNYKEEIPAAFLLSFLQILYTAWVEVYGCDALIIKLSIFNIMPSPDLRLIICNWILRAARFRLVLVLYIFHVSVEVSELLARPGPGNLLSNVA